MALRDELGPYFGEYGGRFVPESLIAALDELGRPPTEAAKADPAFQAELAELHRTYTGRPSIITEVPAVRRARRRGPRVILKREDLNHTGSHKINNVLGQALLTKRMGKTRVIAETGAGQHGVATATAAALFGLECVVYMGEVDTERQALNVARMRLLGAEVVPVTTGSRTLKDAINEALRDWVTNVETTHYLFGTVAGPHPFPVMVRDFQKIIGEEARQQVLDLTGRCRTPSRPAWAAARTRSASSTPSSTTRTWRSTASRPAATASTPAATPPPSPRAAPACCTARAAYLLQDEDGQTIESHSISAGPRLPRRRPGARLARRHRPRRATCRSPTPRRWRPSGCSAAPRASSRPSSPRTRSPAPSNLGKRLGPEAIILVNLSGPRRQGHGDRRAVLRPARRRGGPVVSAVVSTVARTIAARKAAGGGALIGYLPVGFPSLTESIDAAVALASNGVDVIELGLPYSDPVMDGRVIQAATQRALAEGFRLRHGFEAVAAITAQVAAPVLVMTYWNPVLQYGVDRFADDLLAAGGAGPDHA